MLVLAPGAVINGRYRVIGPLGAGGMAQVYEAEHIKMNHAVALKVLSREWAQVPELVERFEREARAVVQLQSPNVARVYDVDHLEDGTPFLAMELLHGRDLNVELSSRGALSVVDACDWVRQAAQGMAAAHAQGIIHRDLKPENLFICDLGSAAGDRKLVKVLDFGLAKDARRNASRMTAPDSSFGTPYYMSPEQIRSTASVDVRTDVWALGVVLYELLVGTTPFEGDAKAIIAQIMVDPVPPIVRPDVPPELRAIVMHALAKDPDERFACVEDLADALAPYCPEEPIAMVLARVSASGLGGARDSMRRLVPTAASVPQQGWSSGSPSSRQGFRAPALMGALVGGAIVCAVAAVVAWQRMPRDAAPPQAAARPVPVPVMTAEPPLTATAPALPSVALPPPSLTESPPAVAAATVEPVPTVAPTAPVPPQIEVDPPTPTAAARPTAAHPISKPRPVVRKPPPPAPAPTPKPTTKPPPPKADPPRL
ncbi:MAG: serine/threonine-protein kinase [Polyangiaceae bacterium]